MAINGSVDNQLTNDEARVLKAFWEGEKGSLPPTLLLKLPAREAAKALEKMREARLARLATAKEIKKERDKAGRGKYPTVGVRVYGKCVGETQLKSRNGSRAIYEPVPEEHKKKLAEMFSAIAKDYDCACAFIELSQSLLFKEDRPRLFGILKKVASKGNELVQQQQQPEGGGK